MNGADYIATKRLSNLNDETVAEVGQTCERVNPDSLGWLLKQGLIVPTEAVVEAIAEPEPVAPVEHAVDEGGIETRTEGDA